MEDRLNRQAWLDAGLERLAADGPQGVRIMPIAQLLGVTKGSFYWHYRDRDAYLAALLEEWERSHTRQIIEHVEHVGGDAAGKLRNLLKITVESDPGLTRAIRSWAHVDPNAARMLKRVDRKRLAYVAELLEATGWSAGDAATLAHWSYCALIGHFSLQGARLNGQQIDLILGTLDFTPPQARREK